jgi:transposase
MWREDLSYRQVSALFDLRGGHSVVTMWERLYHEGGLDALKSKSRGRPKTMPAPKPPKPLPPPAEEASTLEQLRKENEYLRAEVAYLKKLRALRQEKERAAPKKRG